MGSVFWPLLWNLPPTPFVSIKIIFDQTFKSNVVIGNKNFNLKNFNIFRNRSTGFVILTIGLTLLLCFWPRAKCDVDNSLGTDIEDVFEYDEIDQIAIPRIILASILLLTTFIFGIQFFKETLFESFNLAPMRYDATQKNR